MDAREWATEVVRLAMGFGYTEQQIKIFVEDIKECYDRGMTPEACVNKVF